MTEREEFLQLTRSFFRAYVDRIETMSEAQAVNALQGLKAARANQEETLSLLKANSLAPTEDPNDEMNRLRLQLSSPERRDANPFALSDYIEDALTERLKKLRRQGK